MRDTFFITGCARSGTTSLCSILDTGTNVQCLSEPAPNLNIESRDHFDGKLPNPRAVLEQTLGPRIRARHADGKIYGEKNVTLGVFIPELAELFDCSIVFVKRDGRDVVRSLMDWHYRMFGTIYRECQEEEVLSDRARTAAENLSVEKDESDYSRPRPHAHDIWYEKWPDFTRFEMCSWYWSRINAMHMDNLSALPDDRYFTIDYTSPDPDDIARLGKFLGIQGLDRNRIADMLSRRINSISDRIGEENDFPVYDDWPDQQKTHFDCIAFYTMQRLGYYDQTRLRHCPAEYGRWWQENKGGYDWYKWMYEGRLNAHLDLYRFIEDLVNAGHSVGSMLDVGCGLGIGYADRYGDIRYVGMDLSESEIQWCQSNNRNTRHDYVCGDIIRMDLQEQFDIVISQGTVDNSYDMEAYIRKMVRHASGWIYLTAYRGWFPELPEHRYMYVEDTTCFYNDISAGRVRLLLEALGCRDIQVSPLDMGVRENNPITHETRIVARVG